MDSYRVRLYGLVNDTNIAPIVTPYPPGRMSEIGMFCLGLGLTSASRIKYIAFRRRQNSPGSHRQSTSWIATVWRPEVSSWHKGTAWRTMQWHAVIDVSPKSAAWSRRLLNDTNMYILAEWRAPRDNVSSRDPISISTPSSPLSYGQRLGHVSCLDCPRHCSENYD